MSRSDGGDPEARLLDGHDALLLDLDGVVYAGGAALAHAVDVLDAVRAGGVPIAFVTNNASRTPRAVAEQLESLGVRAAVEEIATSAQAAARVLADDLAPGSAVLVVGGDGLDEALSEHGFRRVAAAEDKPLAVVQGYSPDVGWRQLAEATVAVRAGARWVATNVDRTIPSDRGILPGNGTLVAAVAAALGRQPDVIAGKPARPLHDEAVLRTGGSKPLVVGDRLDTDIEGANAVGVDSLLVLTGVSRPADLVGAPPALRPTHVAADLRGLLEPARHAEQTGDTTSCGGWRATRAASTVSLSGDGDPVDGLRAVLPLSWAVVDVNETPVIEVPAVLESWWG